jgi:Tfp pilus assembly protein PilW
MRPFDARQSPGRSSGVGVIMLMVAVVVGMIVHRLSYFK